MNKWWARYVVSCMHVRATTGLLAALIVSLAVPDVAHAGFGRRGSSGSHGRNSGSSRARSSPSRSGFGRGPSVSRSRGVSPSYRSGSYRGYRSRGGYRRRSYGGFGSRPYYAPGYGGYRVWGYGFGYVPPYAVAAAPVVVDGQSGQPPQLAQPYADEPPTAAAALAGDFTLGGAGPLLGLQLSIEGETLGILLAYTAAFAPIDDTGQFDTLHLATGHLTFALLSGARGRLRGEVGVHIAAAPEVSFVAPGAGVSAVVGLFGPLGMEARVFGNVWPYTQLDARAGLSLSLGGVGLGAGVRALYLNDNGVLGEVNAGDTDDLFIGPYATLAVAL